MTRQFLTLFFVVVLTSPAWAGNSESGFYHRYASEQSIINEVFEEAAQDNKMVALILGAQWCHDSRALANFVNDPLLAPITQTLKILPLDVGYLENKQPLLSQFDYPVYFATPTLLLIDPVTKQVINRDSLTIWQNAHNENARQLKAYLTSQQTYWQSQWKPVDIPQTIREFEKHQAATLYKHYGQLGRLLASEDKGEPAPELNEKWRAVKQFRMALQNDLIRFHNRGEIGDKTPNYAPIDW